MHPSLSGTYYIAREILLSWNPINQAIHLRCLAIQSHAAKDGSSVKFSNPACLLIAGSMAIKLSSSWAGAANNYSSLSFKTSQSLSGRWDNYRAFVIISQPFRVHFCNIEERGFFSLHQVRHSSSKFLITVNSLKIRQSSPFIVSLGPTFFCTIFETKIQVWKLSFYKTRLSGTMHW